jgi:hypothetical protein
MLVVPQVTFQVLAAVALVQPVIPALVLVVLAVMVALEVQVI